MGTTYDVACKEPGYRLKARWNDGSFEFVILGPRDAGQLPCGGGQGELPLGRPCCGDHWVRRLDDGRRAARPTRRRSACGV